MTPLARRVASLESAHHPRGTFFVGGVLMDLAGAIGFLRQRQIKEADQQRHFKRTGSMLENQGAGQ